MAGRSATLRGIEQLAPILRVSDARASVEWYSRLGFEQEWEHQFEPGMPLYIGIVWPPRPAFEAAAGWRIPESPAP